jgi:hypothetical protein
MMASVLQKLPLQMKQRGLVKLLAAKPSAAEVLAENPMPEVGASIMMLISEARY